MVRGSMRNREWSLDKCDGTYFKTLTKYSYNADRRQECAKKKTSPASCRSFLLCLPISMWGLHFYIFKINPQSRTKNTLAILYEDVKNGNATDFIFKKNGRLFSYVCMWFYFRLFAAHLFDMSLAASLCFIFFCFCAVSSCFCVLCITKYTLMSFGCVRTICILVSYCLVFVFFQWAPLCSPFEHQQYKERNSNKWIMMDVDTCFVDASYHYHIHWFRLL